MKKYLKLELNTDELNKLSKKGECKNCPFATKEYYFDKFICNCHLKEFKYIDKNDDCPIEVEVIE